MVCTLNINVRFRELQRCYYLRLDYLNADEAYHHFSNTVSECFLRSERIDAKCNYMLKVKKKIN